MTLTRAMTPMPAFVKGALAERNLAAAYEEGLGVGRDEAEAARLYQLSADQGDQSAEYRLGLLYFEGRGVDIDRAEAVRLFQRAARRGHQRARERLRNLGESW